MSTAPGANETGNACDDGKHYLSNPYGLAYDGELYRLWQKGFNLCQERWDTGPNPGRYTEHEIQTAFTITDPKNHLTL
jgi:hypothetical protein